MDHPHQSDRIAELRLTSGDPSVMHGAMDDRPPLAALYRDRPVPSLIRIMALSFVDFISSVAARQAERLAQTHGSLSAASVSYHPFLHKLVDALLDLNFGPRFPPVYVVSRNIECPVAVHC